MRLAARTLLWTVAAVGIVAAPARAQANGQLWGTMTFNWLKAGGLGYELEIEPKVLVAAPEGEPGWGSFDVTPNVEYSAKKWLDLIGEVATGFTKQTDDVDSFELSRASASGFT